MSNLVLKGRKDSLVRFEINISAKVRCDLNTLCVCLCLSVDGHPPLTGLTYHSEKILMIHFTALPFWVCSFPTVLLGAAKIL